MDFFSKHLETAVVQLARLPGIGRGTALRLVLHLAKQNKENIDRLSESLLQINEIKRCKICNNLCDDDVCPICLNPKRETHTLCLVEDIRDVLALEQTAQYKGVYHVLGGRISPIEGVRPSDLSIDLLLNRIKEGNISEVIFALSHTIEGDTTAYYLYKKISHINPSLHFSTLAKGVAVGNELQYTDEITLLHALLHRIPYQQEGQI